MMASPMLTPCQIYHARIDRQWVGGYDIDKVDDLLDQCAGTVGRLAAAVEQMAGRLSILTAQVARQQNKQTTNTKQGER